MKATPRLDRRADDDQFGAMLRRDARNVLAEAPRAGADDLAPHGHTVRARHRGSGLEPLLQSGELAIHVGVQGELALDDERRNDDDAGTAVGREPAGEIERMLRLLAVEQRHDDAPIGDRARPAREAARPPMEESDVGHLHRRSWYGTEARITCGSTSSSRFT